jgi:DNA polymerase-3 subunit epsilon
MTLKLNRTLVVLDLETTGTWIEKDRVVELAMVRLQPDGRCDRFLTLVNPGIPIPPAVSRLTGITDAKVQGAPFFKEIASSALAFIGEADLGGFNIERFDLPILEREFYEAGLKFEWRTRTIYDALRIYHQREKRDLKAAYQFYCGKELAGGHTAMADAEAALEILEAQVDRYGCVAEGIESLRPIGSDQPSDFFDPEKKFRWWNGELYPAFGKYARKHSLKELVEKDPEYLQWLLTTDLGSQAKELIRLALAGRFPDPPLQKIG